MSQTESIDRTEGDCEGECGPIAYEVADWKMGNPTGVYCDRCGHLFEWRGGYEP